MNVDFKDWIGRKIERRDVIDERTVAEFEATLSPHLFRGTFAPLGIHWCLSPDMLTADFLGGDGHPKLGIYLPEVGLPRRMWAGGELTIHGHFNVGDHVTKQSVLADISFKTGKSGRLCFVTVNHDYAANGRVVIEERQDIVYREAAGINPALQSSTSVEPAETTWRVTPTSTLLFRYSAMTFNGHRIHYDETYARDIEGYDGLVVHGPMQATLMLNLAATVLGRMPSKFSYRGMSPLVLGAPFSVNASDTGSSLSLRCVSAHGVVTMSGSTSHV